MKLPRPLLLLAVLLGLPPAALHADGGAVIGQGDTESFRITLFASPGTVRAGMSDLSVLVQDRKTLSPVLNAAVRLQIDATSDTDDKLQAWVPPCCSMEPSGTLASLQATHGAAQNRLLYAVTTAFPKSGPFKIRTLVQKDGTSESITSALEVRPPLPPAASFWAFLALPPLLIGGYALRQRIRR